MPFSISGLLSSRETDIGQRVLVQGSISVEGWQQSWYGKRHTLIYLSHISTLNFKLTSDTDTKLMDMSDRLRDNSPDMETPTNLSSLDTDLSQTTIDSWAEVTSWGSREAWYRVISVLPRYLPMGWYRYGTSGVYVWAKLTLLLINMW